MLNELHIENLAVIERADIRFAPGLNVLTGETGAGKSIVIDSIGAVLGDRVSREMVRRGAEHAVVTATFDISEETERFLRENEIDIEDELILQRRIGSDGKSSCRICGVPVSAAQLKELASKLVDIHGQNDGRQLTDERRHLEYLDRFGVLAPLLSEYSVLYARFYDIKKQIESLRLDEEEKDKKGKLVHQERYAGSMSRSFYIGESLTEEDVKAKYENGVLTLEFPKEKAIIVAINSTYQMDVLIKC